MRLSVKDVVARLGVTEKEVRRWVEQEGLPASRIDGQFRFNAAAVLEWATARGMKLPASLIDDSSVMRSTRQPEVSSALREGGILENVEAKDRRAALAVMIGSIHLPRGVHRESLLNVLLAREALASTGVGDGIAIPHVRNPIVLRIGKPVILLALLKTPIDFGALDGKPVHALFLVVSPTTRAHLHLLSRLGFLLQDPGVRETLVDPARHPSPAIILERIEQAESRIEGDSHRPALDEKKR